MKTPGGNFLYQMAPFDEAGDEGHVDARAHTQRQRLWNIDRLFGPSFLTTITPCCLLPVTSDFDDERRVPTIERAGQCSLLTECGYRCC